MTPTEKTCTKCGETKPLDEFGKHAKSADGLNHACRTCKSEYDRAYRLRRFGAPPPHPDHFTPDHPRRMKRCSKCRATLPRGDFSLDRNREDGLFPQCRACRSGYMAGYHARAEVKDRSARWTAKRREELSGLSCHVDGCDKPPSSKPGGLCAMHRARLGRHGDIDTVKTPTLPTGTDHPGWKGRDVGYTAAHDRVRRLHGSASEHPCSQCGDAAYHWAYDHSDPHELVQVINGSACPYSPDPDRYRPMCVPCHKEYDLAILSGLTVEGLQSALDDLTEDELEAAIDAEIDRWTK